MYQCMYFIMLYIHQIRICNIFFTHLGIYASVNKVIISPGIGLWPDQCQAVIWANAGSLIIIPFRKKNQWNFNQNPISFIHSLCKTDVSLAHDGVTHCAVMSLFVISASFLIIAECKQQCYMSFPLSLGYVFCVPWQQGSWGQHGAHLGPTRPMWAPCWPHEPCYLGCDTLLCQAMEPVALWTHLWPTTNAGPHKPYGCMGIKIPLFGHSSESQQYIYWVWIVWTKLCMKSFFCISQDLPICLKLSVGGLFLWGN